MQHADRLGGDQRRLLGGLGDHGIAGGERGGDLAGEDRERKIPRADADDGAERAGEPGNERARRLVRVIAQEIDRLAHFRDRVGVGLAGLAHDESDERVASGFERVGGARAGIAARSVGGIAAQAGRGALADIERLCDLGGARMTRVPTMSPDRRG